MTRQQWLAEAMDILAERGAAGLSLNNLIEQFHVTKGSFYWHFRNQADFHEALVDYWHRVHTVAVAEHIDSLECSPAERLEELLMMIVVDRHSDYDGVVVGLAVQYPDLRPRVAASFEYRTRRVRGYLSKMGYRGKELATRTRMIVAFATGEPTVNANLSRKARIAQVRDNCRFLFGPR